MTTQKPPISREQAKAFPGSMEVRELVIAYQGPWDLIVDAVYNAGLYLFKIEIPVDGTEENAIPAYGIGVMLDG